MDSDDRPVGELLSRRDALALLGLTGTAALAGYRFRKDAEAAPAHPAAGAARIDCVVRPAQTEGPYFVPVELHRADIRSEPASGRVKEGLPLALTFRVSRLGDTGCTPIEGAQVDVWQCDAAGIYSGVRDRNFSTVNQQFLRGYQITDADGIARFTTIYPGWYPGRTVHVHFKVRTSPRETSGYEFISQLYFDDALTDRVHAQPAYVQSGGRRVRNTGDGIYRRSGGEQLMLDVRGDERRALEGEFSIGLRF